MIRLELPYPVSLNRAYRVNYKNKTLYKSKQAKDFQKAVVAAVVAQGYGNLKLECDLVMTKYLHTPDQRKRDLDNVNKLTNDALMTAGLMIDDDQIVENHEYKYRDGKGLFIIELEKLEMFS